MSERSAMVYSHTDTDAPGTDTLLSAVAHSHRRAVLGLLHEHDTVSIDSLARQISARNVAGGTGAFTGELIRDVRISLI